MLSILLSSPILALNVVFRCTFPIPTDLFDASSQLSPTLGLPKPENCVPRTGSFEPKRGTTASVTVVEGSRSDDVWITQRDAVDGKGKFGRPIEVFNPCPKFSDIPSQECTEEPITIPSPVHDEFVFSKILRNEPKSAENQRRKVESKAGSYLSEDECLAITSKIMIAQRHYSTLAQTVILPSVPPEKEGVKATGTATKRASGHLRSRSTASVSGPSTPTTTACFKISPPPPFPLPLTPPSIHQALSITHKKSFSSEFNFNRPNDVTEIDILTAGVPPLFFRGLKVGGDIKMNDETDLASGPVAESTPHNSFTKRTHRHRLSPLPLGKHTIAHKRSSIVCIKSEKSVDDNVTPPAASAMTSLTQRPSLAVKSLAPRTSELRHKASNISSILTDVKSSSNKAGLRPLTLLQDRGTNTAPNFTTMTETRVSSFGKKQKQHRATREIVDENSDPNVSLRSHCKKLKPLKLARSETSKMRGILRQTEVLPQVIVRPPSEIERSGFV